MILDAEVEGRSLNRKYVNNPFLETPYAEKRNQLAILVDANKDLDSATILDPDQVAVFVQLCLQKSRPEDAVECRW